MKSKLKNIFRQKKILSKYSSSYEERPDVVRITSHEKLIGKDVVELKQLDKILFTFETISLEIERFKDLEGIEKSKKIIEGIILSSKSIFSEGFLVNKEKLKDIKFDVNLLVLEITIVAAKAGIYGKELAKIVEEMRKFAKEIK